MNQYDAAVRRHRRRIAYGYILFFILLGAILFGTWYYLNNRPYSEMAVLSVTDRTVASGSVTKAMGQGILTYSKDGASFTDSQGQPVWNRTFEMTDPMMSICEGAVAFCNRDGTRIYVMDETAPIGDFATATFVRDLCVSAHGEVLAIQDDGDVTGIYLYSPDGSVIAKFRTTMDQWGYPIAMDISPDGHLVMVSYLFATGDSITSRVAFYNFGDVGAASSDNFVSGFNYSDSFMGQVGFLDDGSAYAMGDDRLVFFEGRQIPEEKGSYSLSQNIMSVYESNATLGVLRYTDSTDQPYCYTIYDSKGNVVTELPSAHKYSNYCFMGKQYLLYDDESFLVYTTEGECKYRGQFDASALCMNYTNRKGCFVIAYASSVDVVQVK